QVGEIPLTGGDLKRADAGEGAEERFRDQIFLIRLGQPEAAHGSLDARVVAVEDELEKLRLPRLDPGDDLFISPHLSVPLQSLLRMSTASRSPGRLCRRSNRVISLIRTGPA